MRKVKLQMQLSIDGYVAGPNGEMDWMVWDWDKELLNYVRKLTEPIDCIILGRVLAQGFIDHWKGMAADPKTADEAALKMNETHKKVFSKTLEDHTWENTELLNGKMVEEVEKLKQQNGGDIIVYGGSGLASSMVRKNLIDEYHLFINPVILGEGMPVFQDVEHPMSLELVHSIQFECGIMVNKYIKKQKT
jgi:dihydrofolate reductase